MKRKLKVFAALCGVGVALVATAVRATSAEDGGTIKGCKGSDERVCFTEGGRRVMGEWYETTRPKPNRPGKVVIITTP